MASFKAGFLTTLGAAIRQSGKATWLRRAALTGLLTALLGISTLAQAQTADPAPAAPPAPSATADSATDASQPAATQLVAAPAAAPADAPVTLQDIFRHPIHYLFKDLSTLITTVGYTGVTLIIFIETGLLFPFLPGDSMLVTAGLLCSGNNATVQLSLVWLGVLGSIAAIAGDTIAYGIGRRSGKALFSRPDSRFFKRSHLLAAHAYYEKHGGKTIIIARFMPFIRTFAPVVAGAAEMKYSTFLFYNIIGGLAWIWSMLFTGYILATTFPDLAKHVEKVIIIVVVLSILPGIWGWWKARRDKAAETAAAG